MMRKREMAAAAGDEDESSVEGVQRANERKELEMSLLGAEAEIEARHTLYLTHALHRTHSSDLYRPHHTLLTYL